MKVFSRRSFFVGTIAGLFSPLAWSCKSERADIARASLFAGNKSFLLANRDYVMSGRGLSQDQAVCIISDAGWTPELLGSLNQYFEQRAKGVFHLVPHLFFVIPGQKSSTTFITKKIPPPPAFRQLVLINLGSTRPSYLPETFKRLIDHELGHARTSGFMPFLDPRGPSFYVNLVNYLRDKGKEFSPNIAQQIEEALKVVSFAELEYNLEEVIAWAYLDPGDRTSQKAIREWGVEHKREDPNPRILRKAFRNFVVRKFNFLDDENISNGEKEIFNNLLAIFEAQYQVARKYIVPAT